MNFLWHLFGKSLDRLLATLAKNTSKNFEDGWGDKLQSFVDHLNKIRDVTDPQLRPLPDIQWEGPWREVSSEERVSLKDVFFGKQLFLLIISLIRWVLFGFERTAKHSKVLVRDAWFASPTAHLLPDGTKTVHFRVVIPKIEGQTQPEDGIEWDGQLVIHFAATGDQGYSLREKWYALPLAAQHGVASIIPIQSFYGKRKAVGESTKYTTVQRGAIMGLASADEGCSLVRWLSAPKAEGGVGLAGQLGVSGVSLGGCVAASVVGLCRQPLAAAPLLATYLPGLTWRMDGGALGSTVAWDALCSSGPSLSEQSVAALPPAAARALRKSRRTPAEASALLDAVLDLSCSVRGDPLPARPEAVVIVSGQHDLYMPTEGARALHRHFGAASTWLTVPGGHGTGFLLQQRAFREAILLSLRNLSTSPDAVDAN